jgi:hypothetical protein
MGIKQYLKDHAKELAIGACYVAALTVGFGTGVYVGAKHNKDITYSLAKVEKKAYTVDKNLKKWTPRVVAKVVDAVEDLQREAILDMNEQEAEQKYKDRTEHLDKIINRYESKK